jgi:regulator of RNase E activity RraA
MTVTAPPSPATSNGTAPPPADRPVDLDALRRFPTPTVANALERLGVFTGYTDGRVRCLFPELGVTVGYAVTATIRSHRLPDRPRFPSRKPYWDQVLAAPGPKIAVHQDLDRPPAGAYWGECNANIHTALGCVAAVVDGAVRDLEEVRALGFPLFAAEVTVSHAFTHLDGWGEPVTVFGMRVCPGDLLHADRHGAVVIPAPLAPRVADACRAVEEYERPVIRLCRSGEFSTARLAELLQSETV